MFGDGDTDSLEIGVMVLRYVLRARQLDAWIPGMCLNLLKDRLRNSCECHCVDGVCGDGPGIVLCCSSGSVQDS